jgi:hypothetical protein
LQLAPRRGGSVPQSPDHRKSLTFIRLVRLLGRHLFQRELIDDVFGQNQIRF